MWCVWCAVLVLLSACVQQSSVQCESGRLCPQDTVCDEANQLCVDRSQITACDGKVDNDACEALQLPGSCVQGTCITLVCGNGFVQPGEQCDDGNRRDGDGCSGDCLSTEVCGNGVIDYAQGEQCDCGSDATTLAPSCKSTNSDTGFCRTDCQLTCGDGQVGPGEVCDGAPPSARTCLDYSFDRGALGCSALCTPEINACGMIGWERLANAPLNATGVWGSGPTDIYMVGAAGQISHFDGMATTSMASGTTLDLRSIWGTSATNIYAVGTRAGATQGGIIHFDGTTWSPVTAPAGSGLIRITGTSATDIWALGSTRLVHFDGTSWTDVAIPAGVPTLNTLHAVAANDAWMVGLATGTGNVGKLMHWNGTAWSVVQNLTNMFPYTVRAVSPTTVYLGAISTVTSGWDLLVYNGTTTTSVFHRASGQPKDLWTSGSEIHVLDDSGHHLRWDGTLFTDSEIAPDVTGQMTWISNGTPYVLANLTFSSELYRYGGSEWSILPPQMASGYSTLQGPSPDDVYWFYESADWLQHWDGKTWDTSFLDTSSLGATSLWMSTPDEMFFVSSTELTHYASASFDRFTVPEANTSVSFPIVLMRAIWGASSANVFAVGDTGLIYRFTTSWTKQTSPVSAALYSVWGTGATDVFAVGDNGTIVHFNGTTWSAMTSPTNRTLKHVWGTSSTDVYAVGDVGTILHYDGATWSVMKSGSLRTLFAIEGPSATDIYAVGERATVLHYDGTTWTPMRSAPTTSSSAWTTIRSFPSTNTIVLAGDSDLRWYRQ
jgi:cysteine-rich repeat protein